MATKRATSKASTPTINVSLRIDPKTKYLIDLLAREQKRTITGVIEWAVEVAASQELFDKSDNYGGPSFRDMIDVLWSTDDAMKLIALALNKPSLLDYDEMRIWETIKASPDFWLIANPGTQKSLKQSFIDSAMIQKYWEPLIEHVQKTRHSPSVQPFSLTKHGVPKEEIENRKIGEPPQYPGDQDFDPDIPF